VKKGEKLKIMNRNHEYVNAKNHHESYISYQRKYIDSPRESDKVILEMLEKQLGAQSASVLDVGCSQGNLLRHIRRKFPSLELFGCDLSQDEVDAAKELTTDEDNISFFCMDLAQPNSLEQYDCIVLNAILFSISNTDISLALSNLAKLVKKKGTVIVFDFFHTKAHNLMILEEVLVENGYHNNLEINFRNVYWFEERIRKHGLILESYHPFNIPVDLVENEDSLTSFTTKTELGTRITFRGALAQPWSHLLLRKE